MLLGQHLKEKDIDGVLLLGNALLLMRIDRRGLTGHKSISNGRMSSGMRSYGVMKHGLNLEGTLPFGLLARLGEKRGIIKIVSKQSIKGRLGGCFGVQ